jgi:lipopolysaccharide biosynthesis regulator YciM
MTELLLLLLPVAAASGWLVARRDMRKAAERSGRDLSPDYFKGLNYILNEQPDKAIEVFIRMVEVDSETVETHLALGNLFRRRGEVDRAIRVHQNIIARPTLNKAQRAQALYELGLDYMRAGLLDRAESLFQELIDVGAYVSSALRQLIEIYQQEKDWDQAVESVRRLETVTGKPMNDVVAQYYCELCEESLDRNDLSQARQMVKRALAADSDCVRASMQLGEIEGRAGDCKAAIRAYKHVEEQDPDFIPEIIGPLDDCYRRIGKTDEMIAYLETLLEKQTGMTPMLSLADKVLEREGLKTATAFIIERLRERPSVRGLERLIELNLTHMQGEARDNLLILRDIVKNLLEDRPVYQCTVCGFSGKTIHWLCPSCKNWNSVRPIHGVVGE